MCQRLVALLCAVIALGANGAARTGLSLLQIHEAEKAAFATKGKLPIGAAWFDSFPGGESTYDEDIDGTTFASKKSWQKVTESGWEKRPDDPERGGARHADFFHESESGGPDKAWQTHYPALRGGVIGGDDDPLQWYLGGDGQWAQEYAPSRFAGEHLNPQAKGAEWFDASVRQFDNLGRDRLPPKDSAKRLLTWTERAVNTSLVCADPGCTATTQLVVYDPATEQAEHCHLSLLMHPTDFDDQYSGERLEWVDINNVTVNRDCFPMENGCNETTQKPMFHCINDLSLDSIIDSTGVLNISARIPDVVDECPYEGNLLSAVPVVTCMVTPLVPEPEEPPPPEPVLPEVPTTAQYVYRKGPLKCMERGCIARTSFNLNETAVSLQECMMRVSVYQTDYDEEEGTVELIEYVTVDGTTLGTNYKPGGNPCRDEWAGRPRGEELIVLQDDDYNVTQDAQDGHLEVEMKISRHVDECSYEGYLLNGFVELNCTLAPPPESES